MGWRAARVILAVSVAVGVIAAAAGAAAPLAVIDSMPPAATNNTSATFTFHAASKGASFLCKLDAGTFAACTSPHPVNGLSEGSHTFAVKTNATGDTPATYTWTVDLTPPTTTVTQQPPAISTSRTSTFAFSSPDPSATFRCTLNGSAPQPCNSPVVYSNLADGTRTLLIQAVDPAGNVDTQAQPITWTVDATPPDTTLTPPDQLAANSEPTFTFTSSEPGSTFQCSLGDQPFAACSSPDTVFVKSGPHRFRVRAVDAAGNVDPTPAVLKWRNDVTPPKRPRLFLFSAPMAGAAGIAPLPSGGAISLTPTNPLSELVLRTPRFILATRLQAQWRSPDPTAVSYDVWVTTAPGGLPASNGKVFKRLSATKTRAITIRPGNGNTVCVHVDARDDVGNTSPATVRCTTVPSQLGPAPQVGPRIKASGAWGGHYILVTKTHGYYLPSKQQGFPAPDYVAIAAARCRACGKLEIGWAPFPSGPILKPRTLDLKGSSRSAIWGLFTINLRRAGVGLRGSGVVMIIAESGKVRLAGLGASLRHE